MKNKKQKKSKGSPSTRVKLGTGAAAGCKTKAGINNGRSSNRRVGKGSWLQIDGEDFHRWAARHFRPMAWLIAFLLIVQAITSGVPWFSDKPFKPTLAQGNEFTMNSGYYVGSGVARSITGIGFQPDLVIIKSDTSAGYAVWRTSAMSGDSTAYFTGGGANFAGGVTALASDGFSLGTDTKVNTLNVRYTWTAFGNSGSTNFKVGTYTGDGQDSRSIPGVGFQPDLVWTKINGSFGPIDTGVWRSSAMGVGDVSQYFGASSQAANLIQALEADGFQVGSDGNVNNSGSTFFYAAFKITANEFNVGTYDGNGANDRSITGVGFKPDFMWTKLATASASQAAVMRDNQLYGDESHLFSNAANVTDCIQAFESDGFQVGTNVQVNSATAGQNTYYYAAWKGVPASSPTGEFQMNSGYYVGSGVARSITGVGFQPDLVIVKSDSTTQYAVWRSSVMSGNSTAYLAINTANFTGGVTSLDSNGFSLGTNATVNSSNVRYTWTAFQGTGSTNFKVGAYTGTGGDNRSITGVGFQPDLVWVKGSGAQTPTWRSSTMVGDVSQYFAATNQASDLIQALESDGFQVGTGVTNTAAVLYFYAAFKITANEFNVGTYAGDGNDNRSISDVGFQPDLAWTKLATATTPQYGAMRNNQQYGDESNLLSNVANAVDHIQAFEANGFQVGTNARVNSATAGENTYYYAAWKGVPAPVAPSGEFQMNSGYYVGSGVARSITGMGFQPDLVIIKSDGSAAPVWRSSTMSGDSTAWLVNNGANFTGAVTSLDSNGFSLGTNSTVNSLNTRYTWTAFQGTGSTNFKVGAYTGTGGDSRSITGIGFQPDLVWVKGGGVVGVWRSSAMVGDVSQYFGTSNQASNLIQALESDGFQIGAGLDVNTSAAIYFYAAFKITANKFNVGTYEGDGTDNRSIAVGFQPDLAWTRVATAASSPEGVVRDTQLYGDESHLTFSTANAVNCIQAFESNGFQVGSDTKVNSATVGERTYYWVAWKGVPAPAAPSGEFGMKTGSYSGNGTSQSVSGLGFQPALVMIKSDTLPATLGYTVWRSSLVGGPNGDSTVYLGYAGTPFTGGITSLDSNGFAVGADNNVNASGVTYRWIAFSNGSSTNFKVGAYTGTGGDNRSITGIGFQPDLVWMVGSSGVPSVWRSSIMAGDISQYFINNAEGSNLIQALEADGFQVGTSGSTNGAAVRYFYAAFKITSGKFSVGTYNGDGNNDRTITTTGMDPDWAWVKRTTAVNGVHRSNTLAGDNTQYFTILANAANLIDQLQTGGFRVDNDANGKVNASGGTYYWAAWAIYAPLDHFTVTVPGGEIAQDTPFSVTITAKDAGGTTTTKVTTEVAVAVNSGTVLPLTIAQNEFTDDGVWTGNVTVSSIVGKPTVTITVSSNGKTGTGDQVIVGTPGPLNSFTVDAPSTATSGEAFSVTATAKDAWGTTTTNVGSTDVTVSVSTGTVVPDLVAISEFSDDGVWTGNVTISGIVEQPTVTLTFSVNPTGDAEIIMTGVPANAANVSAARQSDIEFLVTWQDTSVVETSWRIERNTDNGSGFEGWVEVGSTAAGITQWYDNAANNPGNPPQADRRYQYRVRAQNAVGYGEYGTDGVTHYTTPDAPASVASARVSNSEFSVSWTDLAAVTNTHRPQRDSNGDDYLTDLGTSESSPKTDTTGLTVNSRYRYRVRAEAGSLPSDWSYGNFEYTTPPAPSGLGITADYPTQVTFHWTDNSAYEDGFRIWVKVGTGDFAELTPGTNTVGAGETSYLYSSALPNRAYQFKIFAHIGATPTNGELLSDEAVSSTVYSLASVPNNLTATADSDSQITFTWESNGNPAGTEYYAENITKGTNSGWITTSWVSTELSSSTQYFFRVKARNGDLVPTAFSDTANATTLAGGEEAPGGGYNPPQVIEETPLVPEPFREPAGGWSVKINGGAMYTISREVVLVLEGGPDAAEFMVSENPTLTGASKEKYGENQVETAIFEPLMRSASINKLFILSAGDGEKTVYARFFNVEGKISPVASDTIILDTQPPSFTLITPYAGQTLTDKQPTFKGTAEKAATVSLTLNEILIYQTEVGEDGLWQYQSKEELLNGKYALMVGVRDVAGNQTTPLKTSFTIYSKPLVVKKPEVPVKPLPTVPMVEKPTVTPEAPMALQPVVPKQPAAPALALNLGIVVRQAQLAWAGWQQFWTNFNESQQQRLGQALDGIRAGQKAVGQYLALVNQAIAVRTNEIVTNLANAIQTGVQTVVPAVNKTYLAFVEHQREMIENNRLARELQKEQLAERKAQWVEEHRLATEQRTQDLAKQQEEQKARLAALAEQRAKAVEERKAQLAEEQRLASEQRAQELAKRQEEQKARLAVLAEQRAKAAEERKAKLAERAEQLAVQKEQLAEEQRLAQEKRAQEAAALKEKQATRLAELVEKKTKLAEETKLRQAEAAQQFAEKRQWLAAVQIERTAAIKAGMAGVGRAVAGVANRIQLALRQAGMKLQLALRLAPKTEIPLTKVASRPPDGLRTEQVAFAAPFGNIDVSVRGGQLRLVAGMQVKAFVKVTKPVETITGELIFTKELAKEKQQMAFDKIFGISTAYAANGAAVAQKKWLVAEYVFADPEKDGIYTADVQLPPVDGKYQLQTHIAYKTGQTKDIATEVLIDPEGYIFTADPRGEIRVSGATVTLDWLNPTSQVWENWPAELYAQVNPQKTNKTGEYSFLVPAGRYSLRVEAPDYLPYKSEAFDVQEGVPVHQTIELHPAG